MKQLALSTDGLHFSRYSHHPLLIPDNDDPGTVGVTGRGISLARSLYIKEEQTGKYYMFICASSKVTGNFQGCVGLAVSEKILDLTSCYRLL